MRSLRKFGGSVSKVAVEQIVRDLGRMSQVSDGLTIQRKVALSEGVRLGVIHNIRKDKVHKYLCPFCENND